MPPLNLQGRGCLKRLGTKLKEMGFKKALLVTDKVLRTTGLVDKVTGMLEYGYGIDTIIYDGTQPNPTTTNVYDGVKLLQKHECDLVISLGGGSPHDCAKAIALIATNGGRVCNFEGMDKVRKAAMPLAAINTTAGTASEMTRFCIITNPKNHVKMALVDHHVTPMISVNDPELMTGMPKGLTAATGMDALTHAMEAYVSTQATPITDACASKAIELIVNYLPRAVDNGEDMEAREMMAYAEFLAGMAFNNAGLGLVHAMAHQLGGFYDLPHGVCNAVLLPHVSAYNMPVIEDRLAAIGRHKGIVADTDLNNPRQCAIKTIESIVRLNMQVGIPANLSELGVLEKDLAEMAANAIKDSCISTNPREVDQQAIERIFKAAL
ncbi:L-threonine dehydrogenase [Pelagibaculum spongiae]|uniref:L-threonine dehydrogenase n=2 Tax=Pelagibaculum spongiae TaxID=2080658 RepID=A0A2V1GRU1_9GAMM|nr:L-threonine dehydrogenase [Pelagibaculum spongiae]